MGNAYRKNKYVCSFSHWILHRNNILIPLDGGNVREFIISIKERIIQFVNQLHYGEPSGTIDNKIDYTNFKNPKEAMEWGRKYYQQWGENYKVAVNNIPKNLFKNPILEDTILLYSGQGYKEINKLLREKEENGMEQSEKKDYREASDILSLVLLLAPRIPCNIIVFRMVNDSFIKDLIEKNKKLEPIQEKGFMSTSLLPNISRVDQSYAREKNMLKIFVPKGTVGIYVNAIRKAKDFYSDAHSPNDSEEEMLLLRNMGLRLVEYPYRDNDIGKIIYECLLIP